MGAGGGQRLAPVRRRLPAEPVPGPGQGGRPALCSAVGLVSRPAAQAPAHHPAAPAPCRQAGPIQRRHLRGIRPASFRLRLPGPPDRGGDLDRAPSGRDAGPGKWHLPAL